jgi:hypothetical protein
VRLHVDFSTLDLTIINLLHCHNCYLCCSSSIANEHQYFLLDPFP